MALGNLHPHPTDPTKTIRTGCANIHYEPSLQDDLRFFGIAMTIILGSFLGNGRHMTASAASLVPQQNVITVDTPKSTIIPLQP